MAFRLCAFHTDDTVYSRHADDFEKSARLVGVNNITILKVPKVNKWVSACALKPIFIHRWLTESALDVLYVDVDARFERYPQLFNHFTQDLGVHFKDGRELLSGTLYFKNCAQVRELVYQWAIRQIENPQKWDQVVLQEILPVFLENGLRVAQLPPSYCLIFDLMAHHGPAVIRHLQASRSHPDKIEARTHQQSNDNLNNADQSLRMALLSELGKDCRDDKIIASVKRHHIQTRFYISNTQDLIQRELIQGRFFEEKELCELLPNMPSGARVLDVGSNIGNHALFLVCCGGASLVHCYEPTPGTANLLERNFVLNRIDTSRYSIRMMGIGAVKGMAEVCTPNEANIGANFLKKGDGGSIPVDSLDNLYAEGEVFDVLKVDVEGMEIEVLNGAEAVIGRSRPTILIEVANANKADFLAWVFKAGYKVHRVFELVHASNYLLLPEKPRAGFFAKGAAELMPFAPRVPLALGQHPIGWSMSAFLRALLQGKQCVELVSVELGRETFEDLLTGNAIEDAAPLEDFCRDKADLVIVLNSILSSLSDATLVAILDRLSRCAHKILLVDIMDARWQNTYSSTCHMRDPERYVILAGSVGYGLLRYKKLPHKAGYLQHHQLDARVTVLEFEKLRA
jgi:FkbM family methyltransferase